MTPATISRHLAQRGFTLIEVMIALTIGLLISGAVVAIFLASSSTSRVSDNRARMQEGFRYAALAIGRDARMAGFVGCNRDIAPVNQASAASAITQYQDGVRGYNNSEPSGMGIANRKAGSDVLKIQYASNDAYPLQTEMGSKDAVVTVKAPTGVFVQGHTAVVSDCSASAVFTITDVGGSANAITLGHSPDANSSGNFPKAYDLAGEVSEFITSLYFLRANADGSNTLVRRAARGTAAQDEEIAEGIDDFQLQYGQIDESGQGGYIRADEVSDWARVRTVRVCMISRSSDTNVTTGAQAYRDCSGQKVTPNDRILRVPLFFTIGLRNRQ